MSLSSSLESSVNVQDSALVETEHVKRNPKEGTAMADGAEPLKFWVNLSESFLFVTWGMLKKHASIPGR